MALGRMRQRKISAIKYLINLCVYIDILQHEETKTNEHRKNLDLSKVSERERLLVIEHKLTEPIDIVSVPLNIVTQSEKDILVQLKILFGRGANIELNNIKASQKQRHLLEIIKSQSKKIKITEQEKIINNLLFDNIGLTSL